MYYVKSYSNCRVKIEHEFSTRDRAKVAFGHAVQQAGAHYIDRVVVEKRSFGNVVILEDWVSNKGSTVRKKLNQPTQPYSVLCVQEGSRSNNTFAKEYEARDLFNELVCDAEQNEIVSIVFKKRERVHCVGFGRFGKPSSGTKMQVTLINEWKPLTLAESIQQHYGWKIHGFETVIDPKISAKTAKWYKTEAEAVRAAKSCTNSRTCNDAIAIYKVVMIAEAGQVFNV